MENSRQSFGWRFFAQGWMLSFLLMCPLVTAAQINSWTSPTSGNWEDANWSLGILPGTGQDILFTNAGWKAVEIGFNTAQNFPQTLDIESLTISSPTNGVNTLLVNYAGLATPLVIGSTNEGSLRITDTNSTVLMLSSALVVRNAMTNGLYGGSTGAFSVEGVFNETAGSQVTAGFLKVGDTTDGIYNLTNSFLSVSNYEFIGGSNGIFNQQGGTNLATDLVMNSAGAYNLNDGFLSGQMDLQGGSVYQWGGTNIAGALNISAGNDSYNLNGGYLSVSNMSLSGYAYGYNFFIGSYNQSGGYCANGQIFLGGVFEDYGLSAGSQMSITGGTLVSSNLILSTMCGFSQSDGTVQLGQVTGGYISFMYLSGGLFNAGSLSLYGLDNDVFSYLNISGGTNSIGNLSVAKFTEAVFSGGQTTAQDFQVGDYCLFQHTGGTLAVSGTTTLGLCKWLEQAGGQFGKLQLTSYCELTVSNVNSCVIRFADSSSLPWTNFSSLYIEQWNGSLSGGGQHQIYFGTNFSGLTRQQLQYITFFEPAGLPLGSYPARILSTGEIVPYVPATFTVTNSNHALQLTLQGQANQTYEFQVSSNLVNWLPWTNQSSADGIITLTDPLTTNVHARFYRAILE